MNKKTQLDKASSHKSLRKSLKYLFPDGQGGPNRRHIHGKVAISDRGIYFTTSERDGFRSRMFVVRKVNTSEEGATTADPVYTTHWGHLAMDRQMELASQ